MHRFLRLLVALVEDRRSPPVQLVDRSEVIGPAVQADEEKKVSGLNGTAGWSTPAGSAGSRRLFLTFDNRLGLAETMLELLVFAT
jgi:hypothetical protein